MTVQNILVVSTTGMGDCMWGTPGIRELKKAFPDVSIDLIVKKDWLDLFRHNPHLQNVYHYQNRWYAQLFLGLKLFFKPKYSQILIFHSNNDFGRMKIFLKLSPLWNHQAINGALINSMLNLWMILPLKETSMPLNAGF